MMLDEDIATVSYHALFEDSRRIIEEFVGYNNSVRLSSAID